MFTLGMENLMLARINLNQRHGHQRQFQILEILLISHKERLLKDPSVLQLSPAEDVNVSKLKYCYSSFQTIKGRILKLIIRDRLDRPGIGII
jgi:hypothetical protein